MQAALSRTSASGVGGLTAFVPDQPIQLRSVQADNRGMAIDQTQGQGQTFATRIRSTREAAGLSATRLSTLSGVTRRRLAVLERGDDVPTEQELGVLAQSCGAAVFDLIPTGFGLRLRVGDTGRGATEVSGEPALDELLRNYLSMVRELRSGRAVTVPSLRHDDICQLAKLLGDTPEGIQSRLVGLIDEQEDEDDPHR
jgi:transcriptional regulator with XRE-family HTH domain